MGAALGTSCSLTKPVCPSAHAWARCLSGDAGGGSGRWSVQPLLQLAADPPEGRAAALAAAAVARTTAPEKPTRWRRSHSPAGWQDGGAFDAAEAKVTATAPAKKARQRRKPPQTIHVACRDGAGCQRPDCYFVHPPERGAAPAAAAAATAEAATGGAPGSAPGRGYSRRQLADPELGEEWGRLRALRGEAALLAYPLPNGRAMRRPSGDLDPRAVVEICELHAHLLIGEPARVRCPGPPPGAVKHPYRFPY